MNITADQIKAGRDRKQLTQEELGKVIGVTSRTIGAWERGEVIPRSRVGALIEALDLQEETAGYQWSEQELRARIGQLAKQRREELGLSRDVMAARAGMKSKQSVMNFEFARSMPRGENLRRIEEVLEWASNSIDDALASGKSAGELNMEYFDKYDKTTPVERPLKSFTTEEVLAEAIKRLSDIKGALGPSRSMAPADFGPANLYGLAASGNTEHLEDLEDEEK